MENIIKKAIEFARNAHDGQIRKFSGKPYFDEHVMKVYEAVENDNGSIEERVAAILHDVVEDCSEKGITYEVIKREFGLVIAKLVKELTSDGEKLQKMGKSNYLLDKMLHMSDKALNIKLRDRDCNIADLMTANEKFRDKYYKETRFIIEGLSDRNLTEKHLNIISDINQILDDVEEKFYKNESALIPKMRYIKLYEDFKQNNISLEDVVKCIDEGGVIYAEVIKNLPDNDPKSPIKPLSVDNDGLTTVEIDGNIYEVKLKDIKKIEYNSGTNINFQ